MRSLTKKILFLLIIISSTFYQARGSQYEPYEEDITNRNEFKCRWYGGSSSRVSCDCVPGSEMIIKNNIPSLSTTEIEVNNCKSVTFEPNSVSDMRNLRTVRINNVESITFKEEGANWYGYRDFGNNQDERFDLSIPSIRFHIYNSNITLISSHAFKGRINEIIFDGVIIENVLAVAFANMLQTEQIVIRNSLLKDIALQSFKKFSVKRMELTNVKANLIPSRTFSDITVFEELLINNCTFGTVHSGAFSIQHPQIVQVTNNYINHLNGEAFKISSRGLVQFTNNTINFVDDGAFRAITVDRGEVMSNPIFSFESNTLSTISRNSLSVMGINAKFSNIYINETCECASIDHKIKDSGYYTDLKCLHNGDYMVIQDFKSNFCSVISSYYVVIIITCAVVILLLGILTGLILYYKMVYRSKKYGGEKGKKNGTLSLIVPDGRTYRETELHVVVEKNDLLTTDL